MKKPLLIETKPASNLDAIFKHRLTRETDWQSKFHAQATRQLTPLFPPECQTITGIAGDSKLSSWTDLDGSRPPF
jgi:hypothetical protein